MTPPPMAFRWTGAEMVPLHPRLAERRFERGATYTLVQHEERSTATHNHEFAFIAEAWKTLPDDLAELYPSPEHLRKRALIQAGYYDEMVVDAGSNAAALRVAAAFRAIDEFAFVVVRGPLVARRTAKSQSRRAMSKAEFQASKTAVLAIIADMLGVPPSDLETARAA
jgi:hypothetical protein